MTACAGSDVSTQSGRSAAEIGTSPAGESEQRSEPRNPLTVIAEVQPLDRDFTPCDEYLQAVSVDVSTRGISLLAQCPEETRFFRVRLFTGRGNATELLYRLTTREPFGELWRIGGEAVRTGNSSSCSAEE